MKSNTRKLEELLPTDALIQVEAAKNLDGGALAEKTLDVYNPAEEYNAALLARGCGDIGCDDIKSRRPRDQYKK